jgi:hypothetical protein
LLNVLSKCGSIRKKYLGWATEGDFRLNFRHFQDSTGPAITAREKNLKLMYLAPPALPNPEFSPMLW